MKILFVCKANVCRSVMAEAFFRAEASRQGLVVEQASAGLMAFAGVTPAAETVAAMKELGLDVGGHEANPLKPLDLVVSDWVVTMSASQKDAITRKLPGMKAKIKTLHEAAGSGPGEIPDPTDEGEEVLRKVRDDIGALTKAMVERLKDGTFK